MDGKLIAGIFIGLVVGFTFAQFRAAWRSWRGTAASVPQLRRNAFGHGREALVLCVVAGVAVLVAFKSGA